MSENIIFNKKDINITKEKNKKGFFGVISDRSKKHKCITSVKEKRLLIRSNANHFEISQRQASQPSLKTIFRPFSSNKVECPKLDTKSVILRLFISKVLTKNFDRKHFDSENDII